MIWLLRVQMRSTGSEDMDNYADLDFAKLDLTREERTGFPEVVFCSGKEDGFLIQIFERLYKENGSVFGTRATKEQYELVLRHGKIMLFFGP